MAKKTKVASFEEVVIQKNEWPYRIPAGWHWVPTDYVCDVITGNTPSRKESAYYGNHIPFIKPDNLNQGRNLFSFNESLSELGLSKARLVPANSTLICCIGSIGKSSFVAFSCTTNQQINSLVPKDGINPLFVYYFTKSPYYQKCLNENSSATTISIINKSKVSNIPFVLPPKKVQDSIVAKLESLLGKINEARELISEAKESFQNRRAAILAKAFRGELTAKWRAQNPDVKNSKVTLPLLKNDIPFNIPKSWKWTSIESIAKSFQNGLSKRNSEQGIDTVVLRLADIKENQIIQENQREIKLSEKEINKYTLNKNDLLIIRVNGSKDIVGQPIIMNSDQKYAFCDHLIRMSVDESLISPEFCFYYFQSTFVRKYIEQNMVSSAGQNTINQTAIKNIPVPLPTIAEQKLILDLLKDFLDSESESFDLIGTNKTFNHLEKSILSQAFRGQLTSNLSQGAPTD